MILKCVVNCHHQPSGKPFLFALRVLLGSSSRIVEPLLPCQWRRRGRPGGLRNGMFLEPCDKRAKAAPFLCYYPSLPFTGTQVRTYPVFPSPEEFLCPWSCPDYVQGSAGYKGTYSMDSWSLLPLPRLISAFPRCPHQDQHPTPIAIVTLETTYMYIFPCLYLALYVCI